MSEKDPLNYSLLTYAWVVILSAWGGAVSFMRKRRRGLVKPFSWVELIVEVLTSAFAGVITFWLCEASRIEPLITAALVGVSGHMGSRAIFLIEQFVETRWGRRP